MLNKSNKPIFWLCGNYYDCHKKWIEIKNNVKNANIIDLECGPNSPDTPEYLRLAQASDVLRILKSSDMFDDSIRIIRLSNLPEDYVILSDYLHLINDKNILVISSPVGYYKNRKFVSAAASSLYKKINSDGYFIDFDTDAKNDAEAKRWIKSVFANHSKLINDDACSLLVEMKGRNLDTLYVEINKLLSSISQKTITHEHISEYCVSDFTKKTWEIIEGLDLQNYDDVIKKMEEFFIGAGSEVGDTFRGDVERFLGAMSYHFVLMQLVKDGCDQVLNADKAVNAAMCLKKIANTETDQPQILKPIYDKYAILNSIRSNSFIKAFSWSKSKIYSIRLAIDRCKQQARVASSIAEEYVKLLISSLVMFVAGEIKEKEFLELIGKDEFEINTILSIRN